MKLAGFCLQQPTISWISICFELIYRANIAVGYARREYESTAGVGKLMATNATLALSFSAVEDRWPVSYFSVVFIALLTADTVPSALCATW